MSRTKWMSLYRQDLICFEKNRLKKFEMPEKPGVYVLYFGNGKIYVGSSTNLKFRIKTHEVLRKYEAFESLEKIKFKVCPRKGSWLMLEFRLIQRLTPILTNNSVKKRTKKYSWMH